MKDVLLKIFSRGIKFSLYLRLSFTDNENDGEIDDFLNQSNNSNPVCIVEPINLLPPKSYFSSLSCKQRKFQICYYANEVGLSVTEFKSLLNSQANE